MTAELFPIGRPQQTCDRCGEGTPKAEMSYLIGDTICRLCVLDFRHWMRRAKVERCPQSQRIIRKEFEEWELKRERKETP